jgi:hypothetical protein
MSKVNMKAYRASFNRGPHIPTNTRSALYYEEHKDAIKERSATYYEEHGEEILAYQKRYREEHKAEIKARRQRKAALKKMAKQMQKQELERDIAAVNQRTRERQQRGGK